MRVGLTFHRSYPASAVADIAERVEAAGLDDLWLIEDCFSTAGPSLAAAALARTTRIEVGIGILPAVVRHPAITAMEFATLASIGTGRLVAGVGHGVQEWMGQLGLRPRSPLTALEEAITVVRRLLEGEEVTVDGTTFRLDGVALEAPPTTRIPVLAGVRGPRSMELAGRVADGVVLAEPVAPATVTWARESAGRGADFEVAAFAPWLVLGERAPAREIMASILAPDLASPHHGLRVLPFYDDMRDRLADGGASALATMPDDWWWEIGPIGTVVDASEYLDRMEAVGTDRLAFFPAPDLDLARREVDAIGHVRGSRGRG